MVRRVGGVTPLVGVRGGNLSVIGPLFYCFNDFWVLEHSGS